MTHYHEISACWIKLKKKMNLRKSMKTARKSQWTVNHQVGFFLFKKSHDKTFKLSQNRHKKLIGFIEKFHYFLSFVFVAFSSDSWTNKMELLKSFILVVLLACAMLIASTTAGKFEKFKCMFLIIYGFLSNGSFFLSISQFTWIHVIIMESARLGINAL